MYKKEGRTYVLRRKPGTTDWQLFPEGVLSASYALTFTDNGAVGGEALRKALENQGQ
jgi:hypothetical protein